jgi:predicted CopG family antitoxin
MVTRTISITDEAYERLKKLKRDEKMSFSEVILEFYPKKKRLSQVLQEMGANPDLAEAIERAKDELRSRSLRKARF